MNWKGNNFGKSKKEHSFVIPMLFHNKSEIPSKTIKKSQSPYKTVLPTKSLIVQKVLEVSSEILYTIIVNFRKIKLSRKNS